MRIPACLLALAALLPLSSPFSLFGPQNKDSILRTASKIWRTTTTTNNHSLEHPFPRHIANRGSQAGMSPSASYRGDWTSATEAAYDGATGKGYTPGQVSFRRHARQ